MRVLWLATALCTLTEAAALTPETKAVCSGLHAKFPGQLVWDPIGPQATDTISHASTYNAALFDYWNAASSNNRPGCAFFPSSADQVSVAVKLLNAYPTVRFALKGGGHNPNLGHSSVDQGLLIAFRPNSQYAIPSADGETVEVGAGCKWEDVYSALEPLGKTAVGGRLGDVGVAGFLLGGGLSYLSAQYVRWKYTGLVSRVYSFPLTPRLGLRMRQRRELRVRPRKRYHCDCQLNLTP